MPKINQEELRPEVRDFAQLMNERMNENKHKDQIGYRNLTDVELLTGLISNLYSLDTEVHVKQRRPYLDNDSDIIRHAIDIANYAMMIADNTIAEIGHEENVAW